MRFSFCSFLCCFTVLAMARVCLGNGKQLTTLPGEVRSIVEITDDGGKAFGKIIKLFPKPKEDPDPECDKCDSSDPRYKRKVIGMEIIRNMKPDGSAYSGGDILDPQNGKVYKSRIWIEGKDLKVRGYWGPFFRTQTWQRAD